jgi:hypothetical protein
MTLRQEILRSNLWLLASITGWILGGVIWMNTIDDLFILAVSHGISVGIMQWLALRKQIRLAAYLILANIVGWVVGLYAMLYTDVLAAIFVLGFVFQVPLWKTFSVSVLAGGIGGTLYGAITGLALVWLLRGQKISTTE